ncbi:hypothetical protein RB653_000909 [Dictyostelium firmibasis]|uniref:Putative rRNA methyltransferase n=1 Tax=Dictyostelium firmibasis TaxID=79012 RepID=A0AAN7U3H7_9MYCE
MGQKKKKLAKGRLDKFYYMAKEQGYRSRAAFKLIQLNKKYNFLGTAKACLDLCAAPGGWMQVASKYMPVQSLIVGVDLVPIRQVRNCIGLTEDITTQKCRTEIKKALKTWKVDVCLHDGAPNMGTSWVQDAYQQAELTLHALKLATEFLTTGGWFVTKVFRGSDYNSLIWVFNKLFKKVESTKPPSSRNASAEIFVVCQGFLNPKRIDPKLLDPKFVFKEIQEVKKVDVLSEKKKVNRAGYEDGATVLYKKGFISDFIESSEHLRDLANFNAFEFDEAAKIFEHHELTTPEIKELIKDLKVLNKNDFQKIIKWKKAMAAYKEKLENPDTDSNEDQSQEKKELTPEEMEESLQEEMKEYLSLVEKKKRKEKKKQNELKRKHQRKIELTMHIPGDKIEESTDGDLYSMKGKDEFTDNIVADHSDISSDEFDSDDDSDDDDDGDSKLIDDDEFLEQQLDEQYKLYQQRLKKKAATLDSVKVKKDKINQDGYNEDDEEFVEQEEESNPLLVGNKRKEPDAQAVSSLFFDNDLFGGVEYRNPDDSESEQEQEQEQDDDDEDNKPIDVSKLKVQKPQPTAQPATKKQKTTTGEFGKQKSKYQKNPGSLEQEDEDSDKENTTKGFEEVPIQEEVEYSSDSDEEIDDKIKTKALGGFLLRKKSRQDLIDDSFNKYAFNDTGLPSWFADDENRHNKAQTPLTKEMVEEIRRKIKEIDDRPIKKIAEAKARKKYRLGKKMEKTRDKASSIVDNPEMSNREKSKAIEKLYSGTDKKNMKPKKIIMIAKKSKTAGGGTGKYKIVDKRMKKDLRAQKNKAKTQGRSKDAKKSKPKSGGKK